MLRSTQGCLFVAASLTLASSIAATTAFAQADVTTWHNDNARTGQNLSEAILTPSRVNSANFGLLFSVPVDGKVDAEPLYTSAVSVPGKGTLNLGIAATEHDTVYVFNADTGTVVWSRSMLASGETTSDTRGCDQVVPEIGITATPVIDRAAGAHGTLYLVAMSKDGNGNYYQRLHALDLATGAEQPNSPVNIAASYPGTGDNSSNGRVIFDPKQYKERPGLLLSNGTLYTTWASHCDIQPYTSWNIAYNPATLRQTAVINLTPNGNEAAPWNAGAGPAADSAGNIYSALGNGTFETNLTANGFPAKADFGNAIVKLSTANGSLAVSDYWTMYNSQSESGVDTDLGSGGLMLLPDVTDSAGNTRHLAVVAGKDSNLYVADRDNLGKFNPNNNSNLYQEIPSILSNGVWSSPAYFNNRVYYGSVNSILRAFDINSARLSNQPTSSSTASFNYPGTTPSISAYGNTNGIVWALQNSSPAILHAFDANNLNTELYNSGQAGTRDSFGPGNKFITPTIANGKVFLGTPNSVAVFGYRRQTAPPIPDGVYTLSNNSSHLLLDDAGFSRSSGTQMIQWSPTGGPNQKWFLSYTGNGYYLLQNIYSGLFLTDPNGNTAYTTPVQQQSPTNNDWQLWSLVPNGAGFVLQNKATGLVVDDPGFSPNQGVGLFLWGNFRGTNQTWTITPAQ